MTSPWFFPTDSYGANRAKANGFEGARPVDLSASNGLAHLPIRSEPNAFMVTLHGKIISIHILFKEKAT